MNTAFILIIHSSQLGIN